MILGDHMKQIYQIINHERKKTNTISENYWIHLTNPTDEEIKDVCNVTGIEERILRKTLAVCLIGLGLGILMVLLLPTTGWLFIIGVAVVSIGIMWLAC